MYKINRVNYKLETLVPVEAYSVRLRINVTGHGDTIRVRTFLPKETTRISIKDEQFISDLPSYSERDLDGNRECEWSGLAIEGDRSITANYTTFVHAVTYHIDPGIRIPETPVSRENVLLRATPTIQVDEPEIGKLAQELAPAGTSLLKGLEAIHDYCHSLKTMPFKGTTDAITAFRLGEASCNGKSRLFAALARHQGLPTRLVGGLILTPGVKRTSHQWLEVQIGSHWVPFCPTNNYFAKLPATYLPLYVGDFALFSRPPGINFDYRFTIKRNLAIRSELMAQGGKDPFNLLSIWQTFEQAGIPFRLLRILLMMPLGALVLVIIRNVIGLETFGTFLPVLIAVAAREIGLGWGILVFLLLIILVFFVRLACTKLRLLHLPQMAILFTFVIIFMLSLAVIGVRAGNIGLSHVSMFPIAILAITAERLALMIEEEGVRNTAKLIFMTIIAIACCYAVMDALAFQILFISFPELILFVIFLDIWLGHWMGLRVVEYWRFRKLIGTRGRHYV